MEKNYPYPWRMLGIKSYLVFLILLLISFKLFSQPTINSFSPTSGPIGTSVTIIGNNFGPTAADNIVFFGAVRANITAASTTQLTVAAPSGAVYQPISVTANGRSAYSQRPFIVTFPGGGNINSNSFVDAITLDDVPNSSSTDQVVCDIDGDGKNDIAVVDIALGTLSVYRNTGSGTALSFAPRIDYPTGNFPLAIVADDLDGDGKKDLVVAKQKDSSVSVYKNTSTVGNIAFATALNFETGINPSDIAISDFDGDGRPDIAVLNATVFSAPISVLRNTSTNGTISFATRNDINVVRHGSSIVAADFDGDAKPDLAMTDDVFNAVSVFRNTSITGSLSFSTPVDFQALSMPRGIAVGDFDNDARPDLVVANLNSDKISVFKNACMPGSILFADKIDYDAGNWTNRPSVGDLDGDGKPDIVISGDDPVGSASLIHVYKNTCSTGIISFATRTDYPVVGIGKIGVADFNGDGKPEMAVPGSFFRSVIYRNRVGEPRIASFTPAVAGAGTTITIAGENFNDITAVSFGGVAATSFQVVNSTTINAIVANGSSGNVQVTSLYGVDSLQGFTYFADPAITSFTPVVGGSGTVVTISGANFYGVTAVSFGNVAAASFTVVSPSQITAVVGTGASGDIRISTAGGPVSAAGFTFTSAPLITDIFPLSGKVGETVTIKGANLGNDPTKTVVRFGQIKAPISSISNNSMTVTVPAGASFNPISVTTPGFTAFSNFSFDVTFSNGGKIVANSFSAKTEYQMDSPSYCVSLGDWNDDGKLDFAATGFNNGLISVFRNTGLPGAISFANKIDSLVGPYANAVASGDFDGDGKNDLALNPQFSIFRNTSSNNEMSFAPRLVLHEIGAEPYLAIVDFNSDGKPDIASAWGTQLVILRNTTSGENISFESTIFPVTPYGLNIYVNSIAAGDINGDGKPDIVYVTDGGLYALQNTTASGGPVSLSDPINILSIGSNSISTILADLNDDKKLDIVVANNYSDNIYILKNSSTNGPISFVTAHVLATGGGPRCITINDFNGDAKPDIAVVNSYSNSFSVFENSSSGSIFSFASRSDHLTCRFPVYITSGDVDGDSKPDIVVGGYGSETIAIHRNKMNELYPSIHSFYPVNGTTGTTVTITGIDLNGATSVSFGGIPAFSFNVISSNTITAVVGSGASGEVSITTASGTTSLSGFAYFSKPEIHSFTPTSGVSGTTVTITGNHFTGATVVEFGYVPASSFTVNSSTNITAVVGGGASGSVSVTTPGGTSTLAGFTFIPQPTVTSFTPTTGGAGTSVTITGSNFTGATAVSFGGIAATSFTVNSPTSITAVVGTGASGNVSVTTPGGTVTLAGFTYTVVTAIDPVPGNSLGIRLYPNPTSGSFIIDTLKLSDNWETLEIFDMDGRKKLANFSIRNKTTVSGDINHLANGFYTAILRRRNGQPAVIKFLKL